MVPDSLASVDGNKNAETSIKTIYLPLIRRRPCPPPAQSHSSGISCSAPTYWQIQCAPKNVSASSSLGALYITTMRYAVEEQGPQTSHDTSSLKTILISPIYIARETHTA